MRSFTSMQTQELNTYTKPSPTLNTADKRYHRLHLQPQQQKPSLIKIESSILQKALLRTNKNTEV